MIKRIGLIIVLCILVIACEDIDRPKKPDNLISKAQMSDLLYDLYVINAAKGVNRKILETNSFNPETYILDKYAIDSAQFADSNSYYSFDPETYKAIVDKVKERLENDKERFEALKFEETDSVQRRKDSIKSLGKNVIDNSKSVQNSDSLKLARIKNAGPLKTAD